MLVKVTGTSMVRDTTSMGLSNTNIAEKNDYYSKVKLLQTQKESLNKVNQEISDLKNDMLEIKQLLVKLTSKQ
jgi:hypothetical protein